MKRTVLVAAILSIAVSGPLAAKAKRHAKAMKPAVEVTERDAKGRPTKIMMDGHEVAICSQTTTDGCINPREAGLNFGNNPIGDWPGKPASSGK